MTKPFDFDVVVDRRGTSSLKYDSAAEYGYPESVLPLWVADMDFPVAPPILEAMRERIEHGIFGYTHPLDGYYRSIIDWWRDHYSYEVKKEWIQDSPGVVYSLSMAIKALTAPGDGVLVQTPVYHYFFDMIELNGRRLITCPLVYEDGEYTVDAGAFRETINKEKVKMFILCSPHNPGGRVWRPEELRQMGEICLQSGVIVVSDEIHCDLTASGFKHFVFAGLSAELEQITITLASPTKTFNLSGIQISHAFIANEEIRMSWMHERMASGYAEASVMGLVASQVAYEKGQPWLDKLLDYIDENDRFVTGYIERHIRGISVVRRQGTYLLWMDCRALPYSAEELNRRLIDKGGLWLYDGAEFGQGGEGFLRINLACPRETLEDAMRRLSSAIS